MLKNAQRGSDPLVAKSFPLANLEQVNTEVLGQSLDGPVATVIAKQLHHRNHSLRWWNNNVIGKPEKTIPQQKIIQRLLDTASQASDDGETIVELCSKFVKCWNETVFTYLHEDDWRRLEDLREQLRELRSVGEQLFSTLASTSGVTSSSNDRV